MATPGGLVHASTPALPVFGYTSRTRAQPSGSSFSTSEIARASARLSPASRPSLSSAAVRPTAMRGGTVYEGTMTNLVVPSSSASGASSNVTTLLVTSSGLIAPDATSSSTPGIVVRADGRPVMNVTPRMNISSSGTGVVGSQ